MKKLLTLSIGLLTVLSMYAQIEKKETFKLGDESKLTVYHPQTPNGVAVMMCPGGGYSHLATGHEGHDMADWFNNQGVTYAVLEYTLPKNPVDTLPMIDTHAALKLMAENAEKWKVDTNKIGIMGASAGGHLASYTANTDPNVKFQILLYPVISMRDGITHGGTKKCLIGADANEELMQQFSVDEIAGPNTPPAIFLLSADDKAVVPQNSIRYFQKLQENGVRCEMHIFPVGGHGWGFRDTFPYKGQWTNAVEQWLGNIEQN